MVDQLGEMVHGMSSSNRHHSSSQEVRRGYGVGSGGGAEDSQWGNLNRNSRYDKNINRGSGQLSAEVIQAPNFDEQDRFSVMQTLIAVHNLSAKTSEIESHRYLFFNGFTSALLSYIFYC